MKLNKIKLEQGFTLIELMIVIAIIGVLSAIAVPAYKNYIKKSEASSGLATIRALTTNIDIYINEKSTFPTTSELNQLGAQENMNQLGTIELIPNSGESGTLTFTFNDQSSLNQSSLVLTRTDTGWQCEFVAATDSNLTEDLLKACQ